MNIIIKKLRFKELFHLIILYIINIYTEVVFYYNIKLFSLIIRLRVVPNKYILINLKVFI